MPSRWVEMVRHTLKSLGPKVLATRMVRDYVRQLYAPAAVTGRPLDADYEGAAELAAWKKRGARRLGRRPRRARREPRRRRRPEVGATLTVRAFVSLGALTPDDVAVEVVHGGIDGDDDLVDTAVTALALAETYDGGRCRFDGDLQLDRGGAVRLHRPDRARATASSPRSPRWAWSPSPDADPARSRRRTNADPARSRTPYDADPAAVDVDSPGQRVGGHSAGSARLMATVCRVSVCARTSGG